MAKRRGGRPNRRDRDAHLIEKEARRRQQTPGGLLAGDRGQIVLVQSTLSHLSFRHPHAYGRYETISPPPVALPF